MKTWETFGEYVQLQMKAFGEELKRRADKLNLDGLDGVSKIHIEFDIPTQTDCLVCPSFKIEFSCYSKTNFDNMHGEVLAFRDENGIVKVFTQNKKSESDSYALSDKNEEE